MDKLYFIATGPAKEIAEAFIEKRRRQHQARHDFVARFGAEEYAATDKGIVEVYFEKDKIPEGWKPCTKFYTSLVACKPTNDKLGKSIRAEMKSLKMDGLHDFSCSMNAPMWLYGTVIFYLVPEKVGDEWIICVPDIPQAKKWTFEGLIPIKASEYWMKKEQTS